MTRKGEEEMTTPILQKLLRLIYQKLPETTEKHANTNVAHQRDTTDSTEKIYQRLLYGNY